MFDNEGGIGTLLTQHSYEMLDEFTLEVLRTLDQDDLVPYLNELGLMKLIAEKAVGDGKVLLPTPYVVQ